MNRRTSTVTFAAAVLALAGGAAAQSALLSNAGPADASNPGLATGSVSQSGVAAPVGAQWSEVPSLSPTESNAVAGFSTHAVAPGSAYRFADDFTVTAPDGWSIASITVYAYQSGNAGIPGASPFASLNVRIWSGRPGDAGSVVVWGDTVTNRLADSAPLPIYRIFNSLGTPLPATPDFSRVVWANTATTPSLTLGPGTYWLDWQYAMTSADSEGFSPPVTAAGLRGKEGANAVQLAYGSGLYTPVLDGGKPFFVSDVPQDLPFLLSGSVVCPLDFNNDGFVEPGDLDEFITAFFSDVAEERALCDFNDDGFVEPGDLDEFITRYFDGC
ncbi:MAG: EF-hand domain-containing protein [Phycisphaerales bacterium]